MTEPAAGSQTIHRWYVRPVLFVADVKRSLAFYIDELGFQKKWGDGLVCQVDHGECEIILCQDGKHTDKARLFIELTPEGLADFRGELADRAVPTKQTWWGYDTLVVEDPDGNELFFPKPD